MPHNFFLSHHSADKEIANIISKSLSRISLRQISPWFSSDSSENGGLKPGNVWFDEIVKKIVQSKFVVPILTPNSIDRPWIYFESGIAQSIENCAIAPICIGVKKDKVLPPLALYQCYQLTDYRSIKDFFAKILNRFSIDFDEEMVKPILENALSEILKIEFLKNDETAKENSSIITILNDIKDHIDKKFLDFTTISQQPLSLNAEDDRDIRKQSGSYTITLEIDFPNYKREHFLVIREDESVQDVMDNIYFMLADLIKPHTYLEKWILVNTLNYKRMIIREIGSMIPAKFIFKPEITWKALLIKEEYKPTSRRTDYLA